MLTIVDKVNGDYVEVASTHLEFGNTQTGVIIEVKVTKPELIQALQDSFLISEQVEMLKGKRYDNGD
jgi:hypothetical protein